MKREITINTRVVCGFAAQPPSPTRLILPRWGKSFVCSTLPSSATLVLLLLLLLFLLRPDRTRAVPQEFPRPFIRDSFARCRELPYSRCLPTLRLTPASQPSLSALHLVDGGCSIKFPPSRIASHWLSLLPRVHPLVPLARGAFLIGCHYYLFFSSPAIYSFRLAHSVN